jgi:hypothetical protein
MFAIIVIIAGLSSRRYPELFPEKFAKYPGDALWTVMVFIIWGTVLPRKSTFLISLLALATSFIIEFSQLYQVPWLQSIRMTYPGHIVFGSGFAWTDMLAYITGIIIAFFSELGFFALLKSRTKNN